MQYTLDHYIGKLLYFHECVVVPGFGAFLTRSFSAEINPATHMLRPPSKRVVFNARIQDNDGLLAQHIARQEGTAYRAALESLEIAVRGWKKSLRAGRKVNLSGIGRLYMDDKGKLQFSPAHDVNYDVHSYGLNIFRANAMEREQEIKRGVNKAIEKHQKQKKSGVKITDSSKEAKADRQKINWGRWVATLGPVAALLIVGAYFYQQDPTNFTELPGKVSTLFEQEKVNDSAQLESEQSESSIGFSEGMRLNKGYGPEDDVVSEEVSEVLEPEMSADKVEEPTQIEESGEEALSPKHESKKSQKNQIDLNEVMEFDIPEKPLYKVKQRGEEKEQAQSKPASTANRSNLSQGFEAKNIESKADKSPALKANEPEPEVLVNKKNTVTKDKPNPSLDKEDISMVKAQIIVGAFSKVDNAERYAKKLQSEGWDAYRYQSGGLNRVAIGRFPDRAKALKLLQKVKQEVNYQAWVNIL